MEAAADGEPWVVAESVFVELVWALESSYGAPRRFSVEVLGMVLESPHVRAWDPATATAALGIMADEPRLDAVDALLAARACTAEAVILTFDGHLREVVSRQRTTEAT
jgi:predicted nucleic-acid-binding protein